MPMARISPYSRPRVPPIASPPTRRIPLSNPSNNTVFAEFIELLSLIQTRRARVRFAKRFRFGSSQAGLGLATEKGNAKILFPKRSRAWEDSGLGDSGKD